ncbi:hypothetical protein J6590_061970 [Homalodisca vitripennis]|nr:hypothetical protein J6590_061970 [Homalodisca vitripennis]
MTGLSQISLLGPPKLTARPTALLTVKEGNIETPVPATKQYREGTYTINIDNKNFKHHQIRGHNGNAWGSFGYKNKGNIFQAVYNTGNDRYRDTSAENIEDLNHVTTIHDQSLKITEPETKTITTAQELDQLSYSDGEMQSVGEYHNASNINTYSQKDNSSTSLKKKESDDQVGNLNTVDEPNNSKGAYILNEKHDLSLITKNKEIIDENIDNTLVDTKMVLTNTSPRNDHNNLKVPDSPVELEKQVNDESSSTAVPFDASYKFGFSVDGQARNEEADSNGNVQGNYSYIGSDGLLNIVEYEAGAGIGFVIKRITQKELEPKKTVEQLNVENHSTIVDNKNNKHQAISSDKGGGNKNLQAGAGLNFNSPDEDVDKPVSLQVVLDVDGIRRATAVSEGNNRKTSVMHKKVVKHPLYEGAEIPDKELQIMPDGSYAFSYEIGDHSRQESVDSRGNVRSNYQFKTKDKNGKTVLVSVTKTVIDPDNKYLDKDEIIDQHSSSNNLKNSYVSEQTKEEDEIHSTSDQSSQNSMLLSTNRKRNIRRQVNPNIKATRILRRTVPRHEYEHSSNLFHTQTIHQPSSYVNIWKNTKMIDNPSGVREMTTHNSKTKFVETRQPFRGYVKYKRNTVFTGSRS